MSVVSALTGSRSVREFCARSFGLGGVHAFDATQQARHDIEIRIRSRQLLLLDHSAKGILINVVAAIIVAYVIRNDLDFRVLASWVGTLILISSMLLVSVARHKRNYKQAREDMSTAMRYLHEHIVFATLVGLTWGLFLLFCKPMLSDWHVIVVSLTIMGCVSVSVSGLAGYLPAYFGYFLGAMLPVTFVNFHMSLNGFDSLGILLSLYASVLAFNVWALNCNIIETLCLRAENERLADSVLVAEAATEAATTSKWESFAHLSHELRTPMNAVLGFSDMMRMQMFGPLSPRYLEYSEAVYTSGSTALGLIDSLLEMSRARAGDQSIDEAPFDLVVLLREVADEFRAEAIAEDINLKVLARPAPYVLLADRVKIRQIVHAILSNAIKFSHHGGTVSLDLQSDDDGVCITIADNGIGIAPADIAKCQEPFVRLGDPLITGAGGAGLGLPIARYLAEAHGGRLSLQSRPGAGTTVTILLPSSRRAGGAAPSAIGLVTNPMRVLRCG